MQRFDYSKRIWENLRCFHDSLNAASKAYHLILAVGVSIAMLIYTLQRSDFPFVYDAAHYWRYADGFLSDGRFSLLNYSTNLRGYLFPLLLFFLKTTAGWFNVDAKLLFSICSALYFVALSVYLLPWFFHWAFGWKITFWGRAGMVFLLFFFWRGHFLYPLSDFIALSALSMAVALTARLLKQNRVSLSTVWIGFFVGAAINIRPVYQISLVAFMLFGLLFIKQLGWMRAMQASSLAALGVAIVLFPQLRINQVHFQTNSPLPLAQWYGENLYEKQLFWGLKAQKYEFSVDPDYPSNTMVYSDSFSFKLQRSPLFKEKTFASYVEIFRRYPLDMLVSYTRHFFNGLDIFFPTPYIRNVNADHTLISSINYLIWGLVVFHLAKMDLSDVDFVRVNSLITLLLPVVAAIPAAVEVRYFLPAYILAYGVVAFGFDYRAMYASYLRTGWAKIRFFALLTLWTLMCFALSTATIENLLH